MQIAVVDGQGGGIGKMIIEKIRYLYMDKVKIIAFGTNSLATSVMLKAGANEGATGENAIVFCTPKVDVILGPVGIIAANSMLGELTPKMAAAIAECSARKILVPLSKCNVQIAGVSNEPLSSHVEAAIKMLEDYINITE